MVAAQQYPNYDEDADVLADSLVGATCAFQWSGSPGVYARQTLQGTILEAQVGRGGDVFLLVKADKLNLPKLVNLQEVQFPQTKTANPA